MHIAHITLLGGDAVEHRLTARTCMEHPDPLSSPEPPEPTEDQNKLIMRVLVYSDSIVNLFGTGAFAHPVLRTGLAQSHCAAQKMAPYQNDLLRHRGN